MEVIQEGLILPQEEKARTVLGHTKNFKDDEKEVSLTVTGQRHVWYVPNFRGYTIVQYTPGKVIARTFLNNRCRGSLTVTLTNGRVSFAVFSRTGKDKRIRSSYHAINDFVQNTKMLLAGKKRSRNSMRKHNSIPMLEICLAHAMAHLFREQNPKRVIQISGNPVNAEVPIAAQELLKFMAFPNVQNPIINMNGNRKIRVLREQRLSAISKRLLGFAGGQANTLMNEILSSTEGVGIGFIETLKVLKKLGWEKDHLMAIVKTPMMKSLFSSTSAPTNVDGVLRQLGPQKAIRLFSLESQRYDMYTLTDTFRLQNQVEQMGLKIEVPQEIKSIKELHDFYTYIVNRNRQNNYKLFVHPELGEFDGTVLTVPADEPIGTNADGSPIFDAGKTNPYGEAKSPYIGGTYTIRFPKEDNTLREWGQDLSICVGGYGQAVHSGRTIVFALCIEDTVYACIDIDGTIFRIRQANTRFNRRIPEKEIHAICDLMGVEMEDYYGYRDNNRHIPKEVKQYKTYIELNRPKEAALNPGEEDMGSVVAREALHSVLRQRRNNQDEGNYGYRRDIYKATDAVPKPYTAEEIFNIVTNADYPGKPGKENKLTEPEFMPLRKLLEVNVSADIRAAERTLLEELAP
jgi:hypothetical protein